MLHRLARAYLLAADQARQSLNVKEQQQKTNKTAKRKKKTEKLQNRLPLMLSLKI